ncbi:endonuclease SmrB [Candidatus Erwinia haradaeae]|nr:endonuclease SmrB [Candidatus Erwinia haradaeae]
MRGTRQLVQDTIVHKSVRKSRTQRVLQRVSSTQREHSYYFSDEFQPVLASAGASRYLRHGVNQYELNKLYRGYYTPEIVLDLHGMTQVQAKQELGALITTCRQKHLYCSRILHGHGKHILKTQMPFWLAQHPLVLAFHQAPRQFGGDAALLVLIELVD